MDIFFVLGDLGKLAGWHQYDGIARPSPKFFKWLAKVLNLFKDDNSAWLEENSNMIQAIIPEGLCVHHCKAEEALNNFRHVYHCASDYFLDLNGYRFQKDKVDKVSKSDKSDSLCLLMMSVKKLMVVKHI